MIWEGAAPSLVIAAIAAAGSETTLTAEARLVSEIGAKTASRDALMPLESAAGAGAGVLADAAAWIEVLLARSSDPPIKLETPGRVSGDGSHSVEIGHCLMNHPAAVIESSFGLRTDAALRPEFAGSIRGDGAPPVEWSGGVVIARDTSVAVEWLEKVRGDLVFAADCVAVLARDPGGKLEWAGMARIDDLLSDESLSGFVRDAGLLAELLTSGTTVFAHSVLTFEAVETSPAVVLSVQAGSDRTRLLATPGRIRLLRRN